MRKILCILLVLVMLAGLYAMAEAKGLAEPQGLLNPQRVLISRATPLKAPQWLGHNRSIRTNVRLNRFNQPRGSPNSNLNPPKLS